MNYYFLPGTGIHGGIKVGFQFAQMLAEHGAPMVVVTPDGRAPHWFDAAVAVISRPAALAAIRPSDVILFSLPHDYAEIRSTGARMIFHCQGTDPLIDAILADPDVALLSCWEQADSYMRERSGRPPIAVGIAISDCFFYDGRPKLADQLAYMPRRGVEIADAARVACPGLRFLPIAGASESETAAAMQQSAYFLATSVGEWLGLPALEAMAAGCVVVSVPVLGGMEFLRDGETALVVPADRIGGALADLAQRNAASLRSRIRDNAAAIAHQYRLNKQFRRLKTLLGGTLGEALSWT